MRARSKQKATGWVGASAIVLTAACFAGGAEALPYAKHAFRFTSIVESAKPPAPWLKFCRRNPADCEADPTGAREIEFNTETLDLLNKINLLVNRKIKPKTDKRHWGVEDVWSYPDDGYGDCEDYALLKRRLLIEAGIPPAALVMAVVWDKRSGHAVLLARTDQGDYVLDNLSNKVKLWSQTSYRFVKRQSSRDPKQWVYIDGDPRKPNVVLTAWEKERPGGNVTVATSVPVEAETAKSPEVATVPQVKVAMASPVVGVTAPLMKVAAAASGAAVNALTVDLATAFSVEGGTASPVEVATATSQAAQPSSH